MKVPKLESLEQELRETLVMLEAAGVVDPGVTAKLDDVVLADLVGRGAVDLDRTVPTTEYSSRANRPARRGGNELPRLSLKGSSEQSAPGDFAMGELIGEGGMGLVHEAWQGALRRDVAVKTSKEDGVTSAGVQALLKEARLLARLEHPNVPPPDCDGLVRGVMLPSGIIAKNVCDASTRSVHRGVDVTLVYQVESAVLQGMLRGMTIEHLSSVFAVSLATMLQLALDR